ncbi:MAG: hypothetical protein ACO3JL_03075, partial [Myxococcota bacterium]
MLAPLGCCVSLNFVATTETWTVRQALLTAARRGRGFAYLGPRFLGEGCVLEQPDERARLELVGDETDTGRVEALLGVLDSVAGHLRPDEVCVFLLGYEAGVAIDPLSPRRPRDARLGPDGFVRVYRRRELLPLRHEEIGPHDDLDLGLGLTVDGGARGRHLSRVAQCQEYLHDGTLYQANLAHGVRVDECSL